MAQLATPLCYTPARPRETPKKVRLCTRSDTQRRREMSWNRFPPLRVAPGRHKVFVSFHSKDLYYKDRFDQLFGHTFINKSVKFGDVASDVADVYIKRLIREDYVSDASVIVVLVGPQTYCRKHVDWEISAALSTRASGYSGLLGLCLPNHPDFVRDMYNAEIVPQRLVDNLQSGYAAFYIGPKMKRQ